MIGIYIHVPFCLRKCPYCDFYSVCADKDLIDKYVKSVIRNIENYKDCNLHSDTVYFGGGTPSLLTAQQIEKIIITIDKSVTLSNPEITMECNPSSADNEKLRDYKSAGVNRLSFGVQSADNDQLETLGRLHSFEMAAKSVENGVSAGFDNISCDIMIGLPNQTMSSFENSVERISDLPISHISAYMLKIEEGTPFDNESTKKCVADEDLQCEMYLSAVDMFEKKGFKQYEISNFSKKGKESRHNLKYWRGDEYIGIGPAAHSFYNGKRFECPKNVTSFVNQPLQTKIITEYSPNKLEEYVMLGLRLKSGISLKKLTELANDDFIKNVSRKVKIFALNGLCNFNGDIVNLTPNGFLVSNEIIYQLLYE